MCFYIGRDLLSKMNILSYLNICMLIIDIKKVYYNNKIKFNNGSIFYN